MPSPSDPYGYGYQNTTPNTDTSGYQRPWEEGGQQPLGNVNWNADQSVYGYDPYGNIAKPLNRAPEALYTEASGGYTTGGASANIGGSAQGYSELQKQIGQRLGSYTQREAQQYEQSQAAREKELAALGLMQAAAEGRAPSVAAIQQQQGLQAALASQQAMASGARGAAGIAGAQYGAAQNAAALQQQGIGQAAMLRAQEMAAARGQYGQMASGIRGGDIGLYGQQMQGATGIMGQRIGLAEAQQRAQQAAAELEVGKRNADLARKQADEAAKQKMYSDIATGAAGSAAGLATAGIMGGKPPTPAA